MESLVTNLNERGTKRERGRKGKGWMEGEDQ